MTTIALADDHAVLRNGLAALLKSLGYQILFEADNGKEFIEKTKSIGLPTLAILDINMPEMDGYETAAWLKENQPGVKVLALSMYDTDTAIIRMLRSGAKGFILKDSKLAEVRNAIENVLTKGFHYSDLVSGKLINAINQGGVTGTQPLNELLNLNKKEMEFLKLSCSEMHYKEIAEIMVLSPRTIDNYRDALFQKIGVNSRVGLVLYAVKHGIVNLH